MVGTSRCDVLARVAAGEMNHIPTQIPHLTPGAAERGADGAARHPYLIRTPPNKSALRQVRSVECKRRRISSLLACRAVARRVIVNVRRTARLHCVTARQPSLLLRGERRLVGWQGLEPWTNALKGHCSTN